MNLTPIRLICAKEILDYARDRRCVRMIVGFFLTLFLLPIVFSFTLSPVDTISTAQENPAMGSFLFVFPVLICVIACVNMGIDITTGETERGSLETTLSAPVSPSEIVLGKWLAVMLFSAFAVFLLFVISWIESCISDLFLRVTGRPLFVLLARRANGYVDLSAIALFVQAPCFFSSFAILIGFYCRSVKEAMGTSGVMFFFIILPGLAAVKGINLNAFTALVPVLNVSLLATIKNPGTTDWFLGVEMVLSTFAYVVAAIYITVRLIAGGTLLRA